MACPYCGNVPEVRSRGSPEVVEGDLIEATGQVVRAGGSLMFLRGVIETGGKPMLTFSGVIKKVKRRG